MTHVKICVLFTLISNLMSVWLETFNKTLYNLHLNPSFYYRLETFTIVYKRLPSFTIVYNRFDWCEQCELRSPAARRLRHCVNHCKQL